MQLNLRSARRARNAFPLVLLAILAGASTAQETDPRDSSSDPWVRGLPDAGELSSTAEPPNLNGTVSEDGTVPTDGDGGSAPGAGGGATGNAGAPSPDDDPRSAGGARPTSPVDVNESEPNGSYGLAQSVPAAARVTGTIEPARDTDSYRVEIRRRGSIEIRFSTVPAGFGPSFRVYDRENAAVTGWIYPPVAGGATEPVVVDLKVAGAYYVAVADDKHDWSGAAPYTLDLRFYEGDRFEPNESYGTATPISANERLTGTILPMGDYDQYAFVVEHAGAIEVTFPHVPKELTPSFRIYDREGAALTGWIQPPLVDGGAETQVIDLPRPGSYRIAVANATSDARSYEAYTLHLRMHHADANEPNGSIGTATRVEPTTSRSLSLLPSGDYDHFTFEVPRRGITTVRLEEIPSALGVTFRLYDAERGALTGWIQPAVRDGATEPTILDLPRAGRYTLGVANETGSVRSSDAFRLRLEETLGDAHEPNETIGTATPLRLGSAVSANLLPKGDYDTYAFELDAPRKVTITLPKVPRTMVPSLRVYSRERGALTGWHVPAIRDGASEAFEVELREAGRHYLVITDDSFKQRTPEPYEVVVR